MNICLSKNNRIVKEWFDAVGERETYKQFILHNYALPEYSDYKKTLAEGSLSQKERDAFLSKFINLELFTVEDMSSLRQASPSTFAAFWKDVFYFSESVDKKDVAEEAFHSIYQRLTKPEERSALLAIADRLLDKKLKKNKLTKQEVRKNYEKVLKRAVSWDYVLEEELAKEFVNWVTYDGRVHRESTLREMWADKDISFVNKLIETLKTFFSKVLGLYNGYVKYPTLLQDYFRRIEKGDFISEMKNSEEHSLNREYPSFSSVMIPVKDSGTEERLSVTDQSYHYGRVLNFVRELANKKVVPQEGAKFTKEEIIKEALELYRDEVLVNNTSDITQALYSSLLPTKYRPESSNFKVFVKDLSKRLDQLEQITSENEESQEEAEDDIGWNLTDFFDSSPSEKNPQDTLSKDMKVIISSTLVDTGESAVEVEKMVLRDGQYRKEKISLSGKRLIDPYKIYNSLISVTSNTSDPYQKIKKLVLYTRDDSTNPETNAFVDSFLQESYLKENGGAIGKADLAELKEALLVSADNPKGFVIGNTAKFKKVTKALNYWTIDVLMMSLTKEDNNIYTGVFEPLFSSGIRLQVSNWEQNFLSSTLEEKINSYNKLFKYKSFLFGSSEERGSEAFISDLLLDFVTEFPSYNYEGMDQEKFDKFIEFIAEESAYDLENLFSLYGIQVSTNLKKWIIADEIHKTSFNLGFNVNIPSHLSEIYENFNLNAFEYNINFNHLKFFSQATFNAALKEGYIPSNQDPYSLGVSSEDLNVFNLKAELESLARGNIFFDESVLPSSFRNPEGKDIYRYQEQTQFLKFANETILSEELYNTYLEDLEAQEDSNKHYLYDNLFTEFLEELTPAERKRLGSFSMAGMTYKNEESKARTNPSVSHDVDAGSFMAFQINSILNKAYLLRKGFKDTDGRVLSSSFISVPYFKGVNEVSKTKSFLTSRWFKSFEKVFIREENGVTESVVTHVPMVQIEKGKVYVGQGTVEVAKKLLNQDVARIAEEAQRYIDIFNREYSYPDIQEGERKLIKVNTDYLFSRGYDTIITDYHEGEIPIIYRKDKNSWEIDFKAVLKGSVETIKDGETSTVSIKIPRSLIIMKDSNSYVSDNVRDLVYKGINKGNSEVDTMGDFTPLIEKELFTAISSYVAKTFQRVKSKNVLPMLDAAFTKPSDKVLIKSNAEVLGFKYSEVSGFESEYEDISASKEGFIPMFKSAFLTHNLALTVINEMLNRQAIQRVLHGNIALLNKNMNLEYAKRNKQETSTIVSAFTKLADAANGVDAFTELSFIIDVAAAKLAENKPKSGVTGDTVDSNDAQAFSSVWSRKKYLHGIDTLSTPLARILDKIHNGESLSFAENQRMLKAKSFLNSEKSLAASPLVTLKMSEAILSKELTAIKTLVASEDNHWRDYVDLHNVVRENGKVVSYMAYPKEGAKIEYSIEPIIDSTTPTVDEALALNNVRVYSWKPVSSELNTKRLLLDGWIPNEQGELEFKGVQNRVDIIAATTASKRMTRNVWDGSLSSYNRNFHTNTLSTEFYGRQVQNPSKKEVKDPTQQLEILSSMLPSRIKVINSKGEETYVTREQAVQAFSALKADRDSNALNIFEALALKQGKIDMGILYKMIQESLMETGSDAQLIDFHNVDASGNVLFNPNLPAISQKFRNQLSSFLSSHVVAHKVKGDAYAMVSPKGFKVLKKLRKYEIEGREIYTWDVISKNDPAYNSLFEKAAENVIPEGYTYNGYEQTVGGDPNLNTLITKVFKSYEEKATEGNADIYFLDEIRMNKPKVVQAADGKFVIENFYAETLLSPRDMAEVTKGLGDNKYIQGVRIPSQSLATSVNIEVIDFLPAFYGNSIMVTKEIQELAGSDFDIDKIYVQFYDGYFTNKGFKKYENTFEDFRKFMFSSNKILKKKYKDLLEEDKKYTALKKEINTYSREIDRLKAVITSNKELTDSDKRSIEEAISSLKDTTFEYYEAEEQSEYIDIEAKIELAQEELLGIITQIDIEKGLSLASEFDRYLGLQKGVQVLKTSLDREEKRIEDTLFSEVFPTMTKETFEDSSQGIYKNPAVINNELLDQKKFLLTANMEAYKDVVTVDNIKPILSGSGKAEHDIHNSKLVLPGEIEASFNSMLFDSHYLEGASVGVGGIGITVMANLAYRILTRAGVTLSPSISFTIKDVETVGADVEINTFSAEVLTTNIETLKQVSDRISEIVSASTDEAKEGIISRLQLREDLLSVYMSGLATGIDPQLITIVLNQPQIQSIITTIYKDRFIDQLQKKKTFREALNEEIKRILISKGLKPSIDNFRKLTKEIAYDSLVKRDYVASLAIIDRLYAISEQNRDLLNFVRIKKGFSKDVIDILSLKDAARRLKQTSTSTKRVKEHEAYDIDFSQPGFEQYNNYITNIIPRVEKIYEDFILELSPNYKKLEERIVDSTFVNESPRERKEVFKALNRAVIGSLLSNEAEIQGARVGDSSHLLDISLIYGSNSLANQFLALKSDPKLKTILDNNLIFRKLSTTFGWQKQVKKIQNMKSLPKARRKIIEEADADLVSLNLYAKMNPEVQENYADSFLELLEFNKTDSPELNNKVIKFAESLYYYNTIKDAQEYSPVGVGKVLPTNMFKPLSTLLNTFTSGQISQHILDDIEHRFFRDVRNFDLVSELSSLQSKSGELIEDPYTLNYEKTMAVIVDYGDIESIPNYFKIETGNTNKLFKRILTEDLSVKNGVEIKHYYIEVPLLGNYTYHASISNSNVVNDKGAALAAVSAARSLYIKEQNPLVKAALLKEITEMGSLYIVSVTNKDGEQVTGDSILKNNLDLNLTLIPISQEKFTKSVYLSPQHFMSPNRISNKKEFIIDGKKFYSIDHYMMYTQAEFYGDKEAMAKIYNSPITGIALTLRTDDIVKEEAWTNQYVDVLDKALRAFYNTPERKKTLLKWKAEGVILEASTADVRDILNLIYKLIDEVQENKDLNLPSYSSSTFEGKGAGIPLVLPNLPKYVQDIETTKAAYSDFYLSFSDQKKGTAYEISTLLDNKVKNPTPVKVKDKVVMLGFNSKKVITPSDLDSYKKAVSNYLDNGAQLITNSLADMNKTLYDSPLTKDKTANGVNSGMRLIDDYLRNQLGLTPHIKLITNDNFSIFVNVWQKKQKENMQLELSFEIAKPGTRQGQEGITFEASASTGYADRTNINASADATIAIAVDFNSAGEKLTKKSVLRQSKQYISIDASSLDITPERVKQIVDKLNEVSAKSLNIAGNGIYTMKGQYTQQQVDDFTYNLLFQINNHPELITPIESIRSGGQTGFDEAGAKAGLKLDIPTLVLAPKGWKFRDEKGQDISNEDQFKARFAGIVPDAVPSRSLQLTPKFRIPMNFEDGTGGRITKIATKPYSREVVTKNPNVTFVFTENLHSLGTSRPGGGTAIIRGLSNTLGIITKKSYIYSEERKAFNKAGWDENFEDTDQDFERFKNSNLKQISKLKEKETIVFPTGFATGLAKLPTRFAEWLQEQLYSEFGLVTELNKTKTGLISKSVENKNLREDIENLPDINCNE